MRVDLPNQRLRILVRDLKKDGLAEFIPSLAITRSSVEAHWKSARLYWFTDHTDKHSHRVADLAAEIASKRELGQRKLNSLERYLLEMAAWLHDIGMQSSAPPGVESAIYPSDPKIVRERHPQLSYEAILKNGFNTGIPANHTAVIEFVALLARSHGTHFYDDSVELLKAQFPTLVNWDVRGGLLAAILLMADELDLDSRRVPAEAQPQEFGVESDAHWFKHECVEGVKLLVRADDRGRVQIRVRLQSYPNADNEVVSAVKAWIEDKLVAQIAKTEKEFADGFGGYFEFDRTIDFPVREGQVPSKRLYPEMLEVIERDNARALLINHDKCYAECLTAVLDRFSLAILGQSPSVAEDGREDLLRLLVLELKKDGTAVAHIGRAEDHSNLVPSDVMTRWIGQLMITTAGDVPVHEVPKATFLLARIVEHLESSPRQIVLGISSIDELSEATRDWLLGNVFAQAPKFRNATFLVSSTRTIAGFSTGLKSWRQVPVGPTPQAAIERYLSRFAPTQDAARLARVPMDYAQARSYAVLGGDRR